MTWREETRPWADRVIANDSFLIAFVGWTINNRGTIEHHASAYFYVVTEDGTLPSQDPPRVTVPAEEDTLDRILAEWPAWLATQPHWEALMMGHLV